LYARHLNAVFCNLFAISGDKLRGRTSFRLVGTRGDSDWSGDVLLGLDISDAGTAAGAPGAGAGAGVRGLAARLKTGPAIRTAGMLGARCTAVRCGSLGEGERVMCRQGLPKEGVEGKRSPAACCSLP